MGIHRSAIRRRRREDAAATKARNKVVKAKERQRRDVRMVEKLKTDDPPYAPVVMSWLSRRLGKSANGITPEDVKSLVT
jgi:hypothetical protein